MKNLSRREFTRSALAAATFTTLAQAKSRRVRKKPNVLFVIADEWRAQNFGYSGDPNAPTSTFDRFAGESLNFTQMVSGLSVCCPARASMLTGQYPLTHGVYINDVQLKPKGKTLGESFRDAGYSTGYIGKWHLYGSPDGHYGRRESFIPPDQHLGFDYWKVAECTHDYNRSFYYEGTDPTMKFWDGYDAIAQADDACTFIRSQANSDKPYFLALSWGPPHFPLATAPERYRKLFAQKEVTLRANVPEARREKATTDLRGYYAHMAALNDCFAELLKAVDASGSKEDTIVVFTSDHGDMMESQGLETKLYPWEESIRVPLLIRYPRKFGTTGQSSDALIITPDLMPTLLGMCDIPVPRGVQGTDFSSGKSRTRTIGPSSTAFLNMPVPITTARTYGIAEYRDVRDARYTYVRSIAGPWLLYDNHTDPYQMHNLIGRPQYKEIEAHLQRELALWLRSLGDEFLSSETYLTRDGLANYSEPYNSVVYTRSPWNDWQSTLPARDYSIDSPLRSMLRNPEARSLLERDASQSIAAAAKTPMACVRQLQHTGQLNLSELKLNQLDHALEAIPSPMRKPLIAN